MGSLGFVILTECVAHNVAWAVPNSQTLAIAPSVDHYRACKSAKHCFDILERHGPDSFDYDVLAHDFYRLGRQGRLGLLRLTKDDDLMALKALDLLSRRNFGFTEIEQNQLRDFWPEKAPRLLAKLFQTNITPLFAQESITTLLSPNPEIRNLSRDILTKAVTQKIPLLLDPKSEATVRSALIKSPHPALVTLLSKGPKADVFEKLTPVLRTTDADTVNAAYATLFNRDKAAAFQALVGTLFDLQDEDFDFAMSLSQLLQQRHKTRSDGFYIRFATDIANDPKMGVMGRLAGLDARIVSNNSAKTVKPLQNTPLLLETFKARLENDRDIDLNYIAFAIEMEKGPTQGWLFALNDYFKRTNNPEYNVFIAQLGSVKTLQAKGIVKDALSKTDNYALLASALYASGQQDENSALLANFAGTHPWTDIRIAAKAGLNQNPLNQALERLRQQENKRAQFCQTDFMDPQNSAREMPYFEPPILADGQLALRPDLKTATALKDGWLAGYSKGANKGGLYYFDYETGKADKVLPYNIAAVFPVRDMPLGKYESLFWVFAHTHPKNPKEQTIFRVSIQEGVFKAERVLTYPMTVTRFGRLSKSDWYLGFVPLGYEGTKTEKRYNPPLALSVNGTVSRACEPAYAPRQKTGAR